MPIFRDKLHLGRKVPQMQTDDYSDQSVTRRKLAKEVTDELESKASKEEVNILVTEERERAKKAEKELKDAIDDVWDKMPEEFHIDVDDELSGESENPVQNKVVNSAIEGLKRTLADIYELYTALSEFVGDGYDDEDVEDYIQGIEGMPSLTDLINNIQNEIANIKEKGVSINEEDQKRLEDAIKSIEDLRKALEDDDSDRAIIKATVDELGGRIEVIGQSISDGSAFTEVRAEIDAVKGTIVTMGERVDAAEGTVSGFAQRMDAAEGSIANAVERIDTVSGEVTTVSQELNATKGSIETLVSKTDGYETRFSDIEQTAEGIKQTVAEVNEQSEIRYSQIDQKVDGITTTVAEQKEYTDEALGNLDKKIETNASEIKQTAESIETIVTEAITVAKGDIELTYAKFSDVQQTADEIKSTVSAVQKQVEDLAGEEGVDTSYFVTQSQLSQKADEINVGVEQQMTTLKGEIEETYTSKAELSVKADEIKSAVTAEVTNSLGETYAKKGELSQTAEQLTAKYEEGLTISEAAEKAMAAAANDMDINVEAYTTEIRQTSRDITLRAEAFEKNLNEQAQHLESQIQVLPDMIQQKVTETIGGWDGEGGKLVTEAMLTVKADEITAEVGTSKDHADNAAKAYADAKAAKEAAEQAKKDAEASAKAAADTWAQFKVDGESITGTVSSYAGDADEARGLAEAAKKAAEDAKSGAESAKSGALDAKKMADELRGQALEYKNEAQTCKAQAEDANKAAQSAKDAAKQSQFDAELAKGDALSAASEAQTAESNAKDWNTAAKGVYSQVVQAASEWRSTINQEVIEITGNLEDIAEGKTADAFNEMDVRVSSNSSAIAQTQESISLTVQGAIDEFEKGTLKSTYASKSEVQLLDNKIGLVVETENGQSKVKGSVIVENITDASGNLKSQIGLSANHIKQVADKIELSADKITIGNIGSEVTFGGTLTAPSGNIGGFNIADNALQSTRKTVRFKEEEGCGYLYEVYLKPDGVEYVEYHPNVCYLNTPTVMMSILNHKSSWSLKKTVVDSHGVRMYNGGYFGGLSGLTNLDSIAWTLVSRFEQNIIVMQDIRISNTDITLIKQPVINSLTMTWQEIYNAVKLSTTSGGGISTGKELQS